MFTKATLNYQQNVFIFWSGQVQKSIVPCGADGQLNINQSSRSPLLILRTAVFMIIYYVRHFNAYSHNVITGNRERQCMITVYITVLQLFA